MKQPNSRDFSTKSICVLVAALLLLAVPFPAVGSAIRYWSSPEIVFAMPDGENTNRLWALDDQSGGIHLWWPSFPTDETNKRPGSLDTIYGARMQAGAWQAARDVLATTAVRQVSAVRDRAGSIHLFANFGCVTYTSVEESQSLNPRSWSTPICVDNVGNTDIASVMGPDGTIFLAYASPGSQSLRLARSHDVGASWTLSEIISIKELSGLEEAFISDPVLAMDEQGRLHVAFSPASPPQGYPLLGVAYARSDDGGDTWSSPVQLGRDNEGQPALGVRGDEVHLLWDGDAGKRGRYYRYSGDWGQTWTDVVELSSTESPGGLQGPPALTIDNRGNVHALLQEQESLYYLSKTADGWSRKQPLYVPSDLDAAELFSVKLVITSGNRLNAMYVLADSQYAKIVYYQWLTIDADPEVPHDPQPFSRRDSSPTLVPESPIPTVMPNTNPGAPLATAPIDASTSESMSTGAALALSGLSAFALILMTVIITVKRRRQG